MKVLHDYDPKEDKNYMSEKMLNYFKKKLQLWREALLDVDAEMGNDIKVHTQREPDHVDAGEAEELKMTEYFLLERDINLLSEIEEALQRIDKKTYGYCEKTGEAIGVDRLKAWPIARMCTEAQEEQARMDQR